MAAFVGDDSSIALQKRLQGRQAMIARAPDLANGARLLHVVMPEETGWDRVGALAEEDGLLGFPFVAAKSFEQELERRLGPRWNRHVWQALQGPAERVLAACATVIAAVALPDDWRVAFHDRPNDAEIDEIQSLNAATGVSPYPAYYTRSEALPVLTACIRDETGALVATASVADRYHPEGRLGGHVFAGMVSVSARCRGKGLGKLVNALALSESHRRFGWRVATEQVAPDNAASRAMILACGLEHQDGLVSVAVTKSRESFSR